MKPKHQRARPDIRTDRVRREIASQTVTTRPLNLRPKGDRHAWTWLADRLLASRKWR